MARFLLLCVLTIPACAGAKTRWGDEVASAALWHLRNLSSARDCSSLVAKILDRAGATVRGGSRHLWEQAERENRVADEPRPGDLVFFDYTYDANRNGRVDDRLTHVAVVISIEPDGTVVMVHRGSGSIRELRMNVARPAVHREGKVVLNDYLRAPGYGTRKSPRLAGQLFHGFARPPSPVVAERMGEP